MIYSLSLFYKVRIFLVRHEVYIYRAIKAATGVKYYNTKIIPNIEFILIIWKFRAWKKNVLDLRTL